MVWRSRKPLFCWVSALLLAFTALLAAIGARPASRVLAQGQSSKPGVDVLFLVDQSGSMGGLAAGSTVHEVANDPLGLRFEAPQDFARLLAEDRLQVHPNGLHRVGLIAFGDSSVVRLPWAAIAPGSWEELQAQMGSLNGANGGLAKAPYASRNLGNTNFVQAFSAAQQLFASLPSNESGRQRAIIVLTDGQPCIPPPLTPTPGAGTPTATPGGYTPECQYASIHMEELKAMAAKSFPASQYKIFVVAMNDNLGDNYWPNVEGYWQTITSNRARKVTSNTEVAIYFHDIWKELSKDLPMPVGERVPIVEAVVPGPVVVPPYLDTISFTLFKKDPAENLEVRDNSNTLLTSKSSNVEITGENIQKLTVFRPLPGQWRVSAVGGRSEDVDIEKRSMVARGQLLSPSGSQLQFVPVTIEWQLVDSRGQPLPEYSEARYRLEPSVQVTVDKESTPVRLQSKGESVYTATFTPVRAGLHIITMEAIARDLKDSPISVFKGEVGTFEVGPVTIQRVDSASRVTRFSPLALTYEIRDTNGKPVDVRSNLVMTATAQTRSTSWPITLQLSSDGRFRGEFIPVEEGQHQIRAVASIVDPNGQTRSLGGSVEDSFTAAPLNITPKSPVGSQAQYMPMSISYSVLDSENRELKLLPGYSLSFTATMSFGNQVSPVLALQPIDGSTYATTYTPSERGSYTLSAAARVQAPDGKSYPTYASQAPVTVIPTTRLALQMSHPSQGELRQFVRRIALRPAGLFSAPNPLVVEVQLTDEQKRTVDAQTAFVSSAASFIRLEVIRSDDKVPFSDKFNLAATGVPGIFRTEGVGLPPGKYIISASVAPDAKTLPAYVVDTAGRTAQASVDLGENPYWIAMLGLIALALLTWAAYNIIIRVNPLRGSLEFSSLTSRGASSAGNLVLGGYNRNTVTIDQSTIRTQLSGEVSDQIKHLKVKNASQRVPQQGGDGEGTTEGSAAAIRLWAWDASNVEFFGGEQVFADDPALLTGDIQIVFRKG